MPAYPQITSCRLAPLPHLGGAVGARKTARRAPKPGNHCWGHLVKSSEGQLLGGSGRFWAHFDRKWGRLDAQPIAGRVRVDPMALLHETWAPGSKSDRYNGKIYF